MHDDLARAERYESLATTMRRTAKHLSDENRRADLLSLANHYELLAESVASRRRSPDQAPV